MHTEGDGEQVLELFMRPVEKVLRKLMADIRLAGVSTCISQVQGQLAAWQQTFCRAPQQISIFQLAKYKLGKALFQWHISQERDSYSTCLPYVYAYHT
jgi:hypothetical protein